MPGLETCGRCGTSLRLGTAVIDTSPPRASRTAKRVRQVVPRRLFYQARDIAAEARGAIAGSIVDDSRVPLPEPDVLARLIVPGWATSMRAWLSAAAPSSGRTSPCSSSAYCSGARILVRSSWASHSAFTPRRCSIF